MRESDEDDPTGIISLVNIFQISVVFMYHAKLCTLYICLYHFDSDRYWKS